MLEDRVIVSGDVLVNLVPYTSRSLQSMSSSMKCWLRFVREVHRTGWLRADKRHNSDSYKRQVVTRMAKWRHHLLGNEKLTAGRTGTIPRGSFVQKGIPCLEIDKARHRHQGAFDV